MPRARSVRLATAAVALAVLAPALAGARDAQARVPCPGDARDVADDRR